MAVKKLSDQAPSQVSKELQQVVKLQYLPRQAVLKLVWKYIKENDLADKSVARSYKSDKVLKAIYGDTFSFSEVNSGLTAHLTKVEDVEGIPPKEWEKTLKVLKELQTEKTLKKKK